MDIINLKARLRTGSGKSYTRKNRNMGWIPAVYYGHSRETINIEVDAREFAAIVRGRKTTHLINLELPGQESDGRSVIKEIQKNVIKNNQYYHVDFQHVAMDEKISVNVPIHILGTAIGVKEDGGILNHPKRTLSVECLPGDIPEFVEIDVSELKIGNSIHVSDLSIPNAEINDSPEEVIAVVVHPQAVIEEVPVAPEEGEEGVEGEEEAEAREGKEEPEKKAKKEEGEKSPGSDKK